MTTAAGASTVRRRMGAAHLRLWEDAERRRRLVGLCSAISGDRAAAEDLAQETLLEGWKNRHRLREPDGADAWLAAIARNVCLRWARRQGRDAAVDAAVAGSVSVPDDVDVEVELERAELADLLDRALVLLPPGTREVLVQRYVHESPHAEIAARLGLSEDAVSMRLTRGKVVLRRVLASDLAREAVAFGLVAADEEWRETRVWCSDCGRRRLVVRRDPAPGAVAFRCPGCNPSGTGYEYSLGNPFFAGLVGDVVRPTAILARAARWSREYFASGAGRAPVACTRCERPVRLRRFFRDRDGKRRDGLQARCDACGEAVFSSARGVAYSLAEVRDFRREHPRTRALPERELDFGGAPAVVVRYEDALGSAGVSVFFARDTLRVVGLTRD